jgi:flagellar basal-body rod modification protein FlgD
MSGINPIGAYAASQMDQTPVGGDNIDKQAFLQLLVTQLRHQDPMSPVANEDFLAQLAQFSSVEQLQDINSGTQTGLLLQQSITNSLAATLIGKDVLVGTDNVSIEGGESVDFHFSLGGEGNVTASIFTNTGDLVRTIEVTGEDDLPLSSGEHSFTWDGKNESGDAVPDGSYSIIVEATDTNGLAIPVQNYLSGRVNGLRFAGGSAYIVIGSMEFSLADVIEIREASGEAEPDTDPPVATS